MTPTPRHTPGPWSSDLDFIVAPDPDGRHPDIYYLGTIDTHGYDAEHA
jgi:hypothetical protein